MQYEKVSWVSHAEEIRLLFVFYILHIFVKKVFPDNNDLLQFYIQYSFQVFEKLSQLLSTLLHLRFSLEMDSEIGCSQI